MKHKLLRISLLSAFAVISGGAALGAFMSAETEGARAAESSDGATFKDFSVTLNHTDGTLLTDEEKSGSTTITFGVAVADDGTASRVEADDANASAVITGKTGNDHGLQNFSATVPVSGAVKITMSTCSWGGPVTVKNSAEATVAEFTTKKGEGGSGCYGNKGLNDDNIVSVKYVGEATTLTISGGAYVGFFAVEAIDASSVDVTYSLGDVECEGDVLPTGGSFAAGDEYTIPTNYTLYKEGHTLTAWTDGTNQYEVGKSYPIESNLNLTPVFTANTVSLADRTEAVTLKYDFEPGKMWKLNVQNKTGILVVPAVVNGNTIDVKIDYDTNNGGKLYNDGRTSWCQANGGTKFTIPSCQGATISMLGYQSFGREDADTKTTIDGQSDYAVGTTLNYEVQSKAETIDIILGSDCGYLSYLQIVLPVVEGDNVGQTFDNVSGTVTWNVGNEENGTIDDAIKGATSRATVSFGNDLKVETATYFDQTMAKYTPTVSNAGNVESVMIEYRVKPKAGITFKPTKVSFDAVKVGTDGAYFSYSYTTDGTESDVTAVAANTILRNNNANAATAQLNHSIDIAADAATEFTFRFYISNTANDKNIALSNIVIMGIVNGTVEAVPEYTLTAVASPAEGGSVSIYPNGGIYEEGSTIRLTATKNFGYKFINWTNKAGEEVSKDAVYTFDIMADEEMTANFQKLNTYELAVNVEGGANDYMVSLNPQPTMVDGKKMYEEGTQVTLTAASNTILTFANWTGDSNETAGEIKIDMNADHAVTANYAAIDYIVGWDFYKSGNSGRPADFASTADNESTTLILVDENGNTQGWLDKSTVAGGYENFAGAAVNWKDLGKYHFQTKINAKDFTNIKVKSQLLCNYNVYKHLTLDWSIDGETWHTINEMTFEATKTVYDLNAELPQETDHADALYIRWMPDLTSGTIGTESGNDGTALSNIYILADAAIYDDGKNPALVSTVPANGAEGASATGKIVLNFSEKVQLAEGATATLGDKTLTGAVSNKTITFAYTGLDYATSYTFKLSKAAVTDLFGNNPDADITLNFTTMERPTVTKALYDVEVSTAEELLAALTSASGSQRYRIFLHNGTYDLGNKCLTNVKSNISLIGESMEGTTIVNHPEAEGIGVTATLQVQGSNVYMQDITLENAWDYTGTTGRAVCLQDRGDKNIYKNVRQLSFQDTYYSNNSNGRFYFEDGEIHGTVDFLCGGGDVYFNRVNLVIENRSGNVIAAPNGQKKYGYVFLDCEINPVNDAAYDVVNGTYRLGRPWGANCRAQYINTKMNILPAADGWGEMGGNKPEVFAEYNSVDKNGNLIDLSTRKLTFDGGTQASAILTEEQVAELSIENVMGSTDNWQPILLTEQAPTPKNVKLEGTTLTWDDSQYALLWAVCKNGEVVAFTIEPTYTVDDTEAEYSVRAANEMGGLSEAAKVGDGTGIGNVPVVNNTENAPIYNLAGQRLQKLQKGINIVGGKKIIVK
ncbi:MAG: Ig-like domain-containing protein [Prevotella sp.]|nr:Ig-like domain-containing protein [Prevotella sp.]